MSLLKWAAIMGVLAIVAAILGFAGLAEGFADIAKILFFLFLAGVIILLIVGAMTWKKLT